MAEKQIINPSGANQQISDFRTYLDDRGILNSTLPGTYEPCIAAGAINRGDLVQITTPPNATTPPRVSQRALAAANTAGYLVFGVAMNATTAAGQPVLVCTKGLCLVNVGAGTPADTNWASISTTVNGQAAPTAGAPGATAVLGEYLGRFLGAKDAVTLLAPLYFEHM